MVPTSENIVDIEEVNECTGLTTVPSSHRACIFDQYTILKE